MSEVKKSLNDLSNEEVENLIYRQGDSAYFDYKDVADYEDESETFDEFVQHTVDAFLPGYEFVEIENKLHSDSCRAIWHTIDENNDDETEPSIGREEVTGWFRESVKACEDFITSSYYHSSDECNFETHFYNELANTDESDESEIAKFFRYAKKHIDEMQDMFEEIREEVVSEYLDEILDESDEIEVVASFDYDDVKAKCLKHYEETEESAVVIDDCTFEFEVENDFVNYAKIVAYKNKNQRLVDAYGSPESHETGFEFPGFRLLEEFTFEQIAQMLGFTKKILFDDEHCYFKAE
jgi:hypothetical protein